MSTIRYNIRKRKISGQLRAPEQMRFELKRVVAARQGRASTSRSCRAKAASTSFSPTARRMRVDSPWTPGQPVWRGDIDGSRSPRRCARSSTASRSPTPASASTRGSTPQREAALAALMIERKGADASRALLCPMPGLVKSIAVKVGQEVKAGEPLCMVEAMKMENVLLAERDVTVKKILAKEGDSLAVDAVIMEFA